VVLGQPSGQDYKAPLNTEEPRLAIKCIFTLVVVVFKILAAGTITVYIGARLFLVVDHLLAYGCYQRMLIKLLRGHSMYHIYK
jgi:hypothetical protein